MHPELSDQRVLSPGTSVTVEVPATSANLGPGFDCFGLALTGGSGSAWRSSNRASRSTCRGKGRPSCPGMRAT